ncbi:MAG: helix-turn-helix domain-containing protein [Bacteroidota bacterium]
MVLAHTDLKTGGIILFIYDEKQFNGSSFDKDKDLLTIVWNIGETQNVLVDDGDFFLKKHQIVVFNTNQSFSFQHPENIVAWRFNRDFYCIIDHDYEVSCVGILFFGNREVPQIQLDTRDQKKLELLFNVFVDEFEEAEDNLKTEMLRVVLKRLIVKLTRTYKKQVQFSDFGEGEIEIIRQFNLMVEQNFKQYHQVQDYADLMHKSSKTISNLFTKRSNQSPLEVIHKRILLEAKRLLIYTDKTAKEIAHELGFSDIPNFSRFFKKNTGFSPSQYRYEHKKRLTGKN